MCPLVPGFHKASGVDFARRSQQALPVLQRTNPGRPLRAPVAAQKRSDREGYARVSLSPPAVLKLLGEVSSPAEAASHQEQGLALTLYTIRLSTSMARGSALSDPLLGGINILLLGDDGRGLLHRVSAVNDPVEVQASVQAICQCASGLDVGADMVALGASSSSRSTSSPAKSTVQLRFQEGSVDEVVLLAPDVGPLSHLLAATETGTWGLAEAIVSSSRSGTTQRFVCRQLVGLPAGEGAACLTPVPLGFVVYGSGDQAQLLNPEQARALQSVSMAQYEDLKSDLLIRTMLLVTCGSGAAAALCGLGVAIPFSAGGLAGLLYQASLQQQVDGVAPPPPPPPATTAQAAAAATSADVQQQRGRAVQQEGRGAAGVAAAVSSAAGRAAWRVLGNPVLRLSLIVAVMTTGATVLLMQTDASGSAVPSGPLEVGQVAAALLGFSTYKLAVLSLAFSGPNSPEGGGADAADDEAA